ncbi:Flavin-binding monooxygenase-like [Popillia japonica]|uniref:Flavin-containing monooxygenase n=1 Tax=Popillia japonica TaxID=7064 RepID=A0AAW1JJK1_POPJA
MNVYFSHNNDQLKAKYPDNVTMKPLSSSIGEHEVNFEDGTSCKVDVIFYCTGYLYDFPFLHESCGITVNDNFIEPLYKHIIHIEKPTMKHEVADTGSDARRHPKRTAGEIIEGIPDQELQEKLSKGFPISQAHMLGPYQRSYYSDLANLAKTHDIPEVMLKIKKASFERFTEDLLNFRRDVYKIIDDENFIHVC